MKKAIIPLLRGLLALTIAAFLWTTIQLSDLYRTEVQVPLRYERMPEQLSLVRPLPDHLKLTAYGKGADLLRPSLDFFSNDTAVVDLSRYAETGYLLTQQLRSELSRTLPSGIEILDVKPDTLHMRIEEKVTKRVPLYSRIELDPQQGWFFNAPVRVEPDSIVLIGAASELDTIKEWFTERMKLQGTELLNVIYINVESSNSLVVQTPVAKAYMNIDRYTEYTVKAKVFGQNVPVNRFLRIIPPEVELTCLVPLQMLRSIKEQDFSITVDFNALLPNVPTVIPQVERRPHYIINVRINPPFVRYVISDQAQP